MAIFRKRSVFGILQDTSPDIFHANTSNFSTIVAATDDGDTIFMAAGNYGSWSGVNKKITLRPEPGANVTIALDTLAGGMSGFTIDGGHTELLSSTNGPMRSQALPFTSTGITITEITYQGSNPPQNLTFRRCWFTGEATFDTQAAGNLNANWVFDRCWWDNIGIFVAPDKSNPPYCIGIYGNNITVMNCLMSNCLSHGINLLSGGTGVVITDSEFYNIVAGAFPAVHVDMIFWFGGANVTVQRNWCHKFDQAIFGVDGTSTNTITDNVVDSESYGSAVWWIAMGADNPASLVAHNTLFGTGQTLQCGSKPGGATCVTAIRDNIGTVDTTGYGGGPSGSPSVNTNNIDPTTVTFVGGTPPFTTYQAYKLTSGSVGHGTATDGGDTGARIQ